MHNHTSYQLACKAFKNNVSFEPTFYNCIYEAHVELPSQFFIYTRAYYLQTIYII
jgi:hypothetical protein